MAALLLLAAAETGKWHAYLVGAVCAAAWFVVFFAMNLASPRLLGFGDVRLALVLGLSLGWLGVGYVLLGFFAANLIGAVVGIALIATKHMERQSGSPTASSWRRAAPWRCSPVPSCCAPSPTTHLRPIGCRASDRS